MRRSLLPAATLVVALALTACTDDTTSAPRSLAPPARASATLQLCASGTLDDQITCLIAALFPTGLETAVDARWTNVKRKTAAGQTDPAQRQVARQMLFELSQFVKQKTPQMDPPPDGSTREAAATRLVLYMSAYVYAVPLTQIPAVAPNADVAVGFVTPTAGTVVVTGQQNAGITFGAASVAENTIVTIVENGTPYPKNCSGPLPTKLCQYPIFYKVDWFPHVKLQAPARLTVCHVNTGARLPLAAHARFHLAHNLPVDPNNWMPGSTVRNTNGEAVEVLPRVPASAQSVPAVVDCAGTSYAARPRAPVPARDGLRGLGVRLLAGLGDLLGRAFSPRAAYAVDNGEEHFGVYPSDFDDLDPESHPDLAVTTLTATPQPLVVYPGDAVTLSYTVTNASPLNGGQATASSEAVSVTVRLGTSAQLTAADPALLQQSLPALAPDQTQSQASDVIVPATTVPGTYWIGPVVRPNEETNGGLAEVGVANNAASLQIVVKKRLPDLAVASGPTLAATSVPQGGAVATSTWQVKNLGNAPSGSFTSRFYLSTDNVVTTADTPIGERVTPSLAPGEVVEEAGLQLVVPALTPPGTYYVGLLLDPDNGVEESNESNNAGAPLALTVQPRPLVLTPATAEKLPNGTQHFAVTSGNPGPYVWSVNGDDGGSGTFGIVTTNADQSADYKAPGAVPTPATFEVCARRQASPTERGCASVTIKPIPSSGQDVVVFNDVNFFDNTASQNPSNQAMYLNLAGYTASGPRAAQNGVMIHAGHAARLPCCGVSYIQGFINVLTAGGRTVTSVTNAAATITSIPASIKLLVLALPTTPYSDAEINVLKQFAAEDGRIVFIGEHAQYYGSWIGTVENPFFQKMGAQLTNVGALVDCGYHTLPASSLRSHQITTGMTSVVMACASKITPGPNDYPLIYGSDNASLIAAVARIDVSPLPVLAASASATAVMRAPRRIGPRAATAAPEDDEEPTGAKYATPAASPAPAAQPAPAGDARRPSPR